MKPRWSDLMVMPNFIVMGLGIMIIMQPFHVDPISVGWMMAILGLANVLVIYFRK